VGSGSLSSLQAIVAFPVPTFAVLGGLRNLRKGLCPGK